MDLEYVLRSSACRKHFTYMVDTPMSRPWRDAIEWCRETHGPEAESRRAPRGPEDTDTVFHDYVYAGTWAHVKNHFYFHDENHAFAFRMRWG